MRADRLIVKYKASNGDSVEELVRCTVEKWQWYGKYMGEQYVSFTIQSEKPIPFAVGDFCEYRGQVYTLNYVPSVKQQGNIGGTGNAFVYDSVKMDSCRDELGRTIMLDITPTTGDYEAYKGTNYTGSAVFSLYCGESTFNGRTLTPVCALAAKMQANMDRAYPTAGWKFHVDTESTHEESGKQVLNTHTDEKALSFNNTTVAAALAMVKDTFDINFVIIGRDVYIGYPFNALSSGDDGEYFYFGYGKGYADMDNQGKALFQLQRTSNSSQKIVTRLRALGSTKNLPYRYYNKKYNLSQTLFPLNLQLPDTFLPPEAKNANNVERRKIYPFLRNVLGDTNDAYIDKNDDCMSTAEGLREECARWDGSNSELEEIYPTIYEATYGELRAANCEDMDGTKGSSAFPNYLDDERIDEILAVDDDANVGDGIMSETNISNETKRESAVNIERSESQATLSYNGKGYQSNEVSILTATGQYAGTYNISASHVYFGAMYLLGRHQSENITKQCNVKYVLRVYATDVLTKEKKEIYKFESEAKKLTNRDGVYKEIEFVKVPNYKGGEDKKITITSLSDVDVTIQLQVTDLDWSYDQYSISWYLNNSKYEEVETETEWTSALIWDRENSASTFMDSPFHVIVKDMGFDFVAAFGTSETPRLSMKSGACVAREFEIANNPEKVEYEKNGKIYKAWKLTLKRCPDKTIYTYYPSAVNKLQEGDNFVLLNIEMPEVYILAAEVKLLVEATKYLADNCDTKFDYQPSIDDIYLQRNYDLCEKENRIEDSIYWKLYDGVTFPFYGIPEDVDDDKPLLNVVIDTITIKEGEGLTPKVDIKLTDEATQGTIQKLSQTVSNITSGSIFNAAQNAAGGGSVDTSSIKSLISQYGSKNFLSKTKPDTAQGLITFIQGLVSEGKITAKQGVEIGSFVTGLIGGSGARIDKDGNGELESLVIRQFLEVPELRFNRIDVVSGELWNSICFGTIEAVDTKKRIVTLKLQDGELSGIEVGDICRGVFHCLESSNPTADMAEDECGFQQMAGFSTSYFTPTEVYDDGARFKYSLRSGTSVHPQVGMKFAVYGSFTNPARRASAYHTRTYTRYLNAVDTWRISPDKNIYGQQGNLEGLTINEMEMHGYGGYFHNIYMSGVHVEFDRDWLDHNLPKVYSVHLTTYEHTIVTDIEGNPLNGLEELRNVTTGESNVMSGDDNVIATRLAVTTTILAHKGTTPLLYSDTMDEGRFIVTLACVGCTAEVDNGVVKVTSIDKESAEHRVDISVNCEGEGVYVQTFNIPVVKQGENGITADLDNEMASIAANDKGEPLVVPFEEIVSHGRMWYGNEPMYLTSAEVAVPGGITVEIAKTETDSEGRHNYLPIDSEHKQCTLRITKVDASAADTNEIRISLTGRVKQELNTEYSKTVVFKLNKVRMGENALNYQLLPSVTEIKATAEGVLSESAISCGVTASDGKSLTQLTSLSGTGLSMSYVVYYNANSWSSEKSYTINDNLSLSGLGITKDSVRIVFYLKWNGVLIDKEGVPVVANGEDGNAITSIETYWNIGTNNIYSSSSFYYGTWQTNSPAVNYDYPFLWKKTITYFTKASSKTTYECVGKIGDKGVDGTDIEYIFQHRTTEWSSPSAPSSSQTDDYVPTGWDDDPQGVDATYKFEYMCIRRKVNGVWSAFSTPVIWAKWSDDGIDGINGADSVHYEIITDVDTMWIGAGGVNISIRKVVGSNFTTISLASIKSYGLSLRAYIGNTDVSRYIEYTSDSQIWWDTSINVTIGNVLKLQLVNGITSYTQVLAEKSIPCIGYGEQGERGPALRGPQYWDNLPSSYQFYSGAAGEPFLDVVMNSSGNFYMCKKSHIKSAATTSSTTYWSKGSQFDLVATKVLLSEYALINNLGACAIEMKDSNGNIEFLARDGNVTCNTGTFNNVTVNGTINSGAGKIGGFNLGTKGLTSNEDEAFISFPLTGESFLHLNAPNEAALISARNDGGKACSLSAFGNNSFGLDIMAQAGYNTMALQSYGNANIVARESEQIKITGLSVSVHRITSTSDKIKGCDDLVIFDTGSSGSYAMPSAASYPGKVIYVKKLSGSSITGLTGMFREAGSSNGATTEKFCANGVSMMYVSDGSYWNVFYCG